MGSAIEAVAVSPLIAAKTVAFGSRFGEWILRGRPGVVTLPALRAAIRLPGARSGQRVRQFPNYWKHLFEDTPLCGAVHLGGWPRMFAVLKHWRDRRGQARRRCVDGEVLESNLSNRRLGKDFLRLLLKYIHRADVWDWTVANARDAQLGETFIRGHAVHNHTGNVTASQSCPISASSVRPGMKKPDAPASA